jgi:hypothetical protein
VNAPLTNKLFVVLEAVDVVLVAVLDVVEGGLVEVDILELVEEELDVVELLVDVLVEVALGLVEEEKGPLLQVSCIG